MPQPIILDTVPLPPASPETLARRISAAIAQSQPGHSIVYLRAAQDGQAVELYVMPEEEKAHA